MALFKVAYVRGIAKALQDTGATKFASEEMAAAAADQVAERLPEEPVGEVAPEVTAELAANLVDLSNSLQESADNAAAAAESVTGGAAPEAVPEAVPEAAPEAAPEKEASMKSAADILRNKLAQGEPGSTPTGSTITGTRPEQQNAPENATTGEAKLDQMNRPGGDQYANVGEDGVGTQQASGEGAVASEKEHPGTMGPAEGGTNSAVEAVKGASAGNLKDIIKKVATMGKEGMGATITGNDPSQQNTQAQAAQVTGEGAMEAARRPENYAVQGEDNVGKSVQQPQERASAVGSEGAHPGQEKHEGGTNTAVQQIPGDKVAAEDEEYLKQFKVVGQKYATSLPFWMNEGQKVATIQYLMGISPSEREEIASHMAKTAELPAGLREYMKSKGEGEGEEKKEEGEGEEKKEEGEEKKEGEQKEASARSPAQQNVLSRLRRLQV